VGTMRWARLKAAIDVPLRRGAWYRVLPPVTGLDVAVSVEGRRVTVPRPCVEIRNTPPQRWTVLLDPTVALDRTPMYYRRGYLVCPSCQERVVLPPAQVPTQLCPRCGLFFEIAWDEHYLEA
jgi:hypothetical protein